MSLARKAARGGALLIFSQGLKIVLQMLNLVLLARFLSPEAFGLVAMVMSIYGIGPILLDFGLSTAAIQAEKITNAQISNLFWLNVAVGLFLTVVGYIVSEPIASFFGRAELVEISVWLSLNFFINGVTAQFKAQLNRRLEFNRIVIIDLVSGFVSIGIGIYVAYKGYGYWAIVCQLLSLSLIQMLLYFYFGRWLPSLPNRNVDVSCFLNFGFNLMGSQILNYLATNIPATLIGYQQGATQLGLFDRAFKILMLPLNQLNTPSSTVAIPILSKLQHTDPNKYNQFLIFGQNAILNIVLLFLSIICSQTESLIILILGQQWLDVVPIFRLLSFSGIFLAVIYTSYWVFVTKGITKSLFRFVSIIKPAFIGVIFIGLKYGLLGVAIAYSLGQLITWLAGLFWLRRVDIPIKSLIIKPLATSSVYFIATLASFFSTDMLSLSEIESVFLGVLVLFISLYVFYLLVPSYRSSIQDLLKIGTYIKKEKQ